ncbi:MAG TPA: SelL-related redox protein [Thermoanaerobaculia bacterium]|nr:SelL-related redox protein [Thermoanaerobaculia bacterium]
MPCREHVSQLRAHAKEIEELDLSVLVITFETRRQAEVYVRETDLPWPLLVDTSRDAYRAYGMRRGGLWEIWSPASWGAYLDLLRKGRRVRPPTGDVYQLGGDVLIDPAGRLALRRVEKGPADRPPVPDLLAVVRRAVTEEPSLKGEEQS